MNREFCKAERGLKGELDAHGDKSITHRAFIFNAIGRGTAIIENASPSADCQSTLKCLLQAGADITSKRHGKYIVNGVGRYGLYEPEDVLFAGNSGTTARIIPSLFAAQRFATFITGDSSLRKRPMDRIIKPLKLMGAKITGRDNDKLLPVCITGSELSGIEIALPVASAQVKTALLLAGLFAEGTTTVTEPGLSRDHTERMFLAAGAKIEQKDNSITIDPGEIQATNIKIPGDISSAAFFMVAALCVKGSEVLIKNVGLNPTRTGIIDVLGQMKADLSVYESASGVEPAGDVLVRSSELAPFLVNKDSVPRVIDELPILAVAATQANGESKILDASELRLKESDRISAIACELKKMGASIEELPDGMIIQGPVKLKGAHVDSHGDHRIAMSLAVAGLLAEGKTIIKGFDCINISYPEFFEDINSLAGA